MTVYMNDNICVFICFNNINIDDQNTYKIFFLIKFSDFSYNKLLILLIKIILILFT